MCRKLFYSICAILVLTLVNGGAVVFGYPGQGWFTISIGQATVDGIVSSGEWDSAAWIDMDTAYSGSATDLSGARWAAMWSPDTNLIYVAITGIDSEHNFSSSFIGWCEHDDVEIYIDAGNTDTADDNYYEDTMRYAQQYFIGPDGSGGAWSYILDGDADNVIPGGYAVTIDGEVITYEFALTPYSDLDLENPANSTIRTLSLGDVVGLDVVMSSKQDDGGFGMLCENAQPGKFRNAAALLDHRLVESVDISDANKGDLTGDAFVDLDDVAVLSDAWLTDNTRADIAPINGDSTASISDGDGIVDNMDFALLAENWQGQSLVLSSNALDFCLSQILATDASAWGTDRYPYRTMEYDLPGWASEPGYLLWDLEHHKSDPSNIEPWTVGFFPGCMWYMYELTGQPFIKDQAMLWTERLAENATKTQYRDHGFVFLCSYRHGLRLGGADCSDYKDMIIMAAETLAAAGYDPNVGCLEGWDWGQYADKFTVIIDTMMNIEILFWAAKNGGDPNLYDIAVNHCYKTMNEFVRPDGSTCNIITFDETTGEPIEYECPTVWSRGQAWGAHGFTIAYRETGDPNFLETAQAITDYFLDNLPADMVPPQHFNTAENKDSSASAIMAAGLLELCTLVSDPCDQERYYNAAKEILTSLSTSYRYGGFLADADAGDVCILRESNGSIRGFIYGDYYFVEALMRYYGVTEF